MQVNVARLRPFFVAFASPSFIIFTLFAEVSLFLVSLSHSGWGGRALVPLCCKSLLSFALCVDGIRESGDQCRIRGQRQKSIRASERAMLRIIPERVFDGVFIW